MPRTSKTVTEKSTKSEIIEAYKELLAQVSGPETVDPNIAVEQKLVDDASKETVEKIVADLSQLKLSLNKTITELTDKLTSEAERLTTLRRAITISQKELEETQKIKITAGMLMRLIELHKQKEAELTKEIETKCLAWDEEQKAHEETLKREREREEEEYVYEKSLQKKRDQDEREEEKLTKAREEAAEKDIRAREKAELDDLRKKTAKFPQELDMAIKSAVNKALIEAKKEADTMTQIAGQKHEAELKLAQLRIDTLQTTVKAQTNEIEQLKHQLTQATAQVKDIAVAVIEGPKKEISPQAKVNADINK